MIKKLFLSIFEKYKKLPDIIKFVVNGTLLVVLWFIFYSVFRYMNFIHQMYEIASREFTNFLLWNCKALLNILGYEVEISGKAFNIVGTAGVYLDKGCLARNLMGLFTGFVIAYPGLVKIKLWFIPSGLIVINILNIIRLSAIAILTECCPEKVEFNHHYVFKIVVFSCILLMWYIWIFKINIPKNDKNINE
jgi:exosortase/archaeosortase family protein